MKKILLSLFLIIALMLQTGCFGSFALTRKVYEFNEDIDDQFAQEAVFLAMCIIPIYEFAALFDALLFNTIEFWSGDNPISMKEGEANENLVVTPETTYKILTTKNNIFIQDINDTNIQMDIRYNPATKVWSVLNNDQKTNIMKMINSREVEILLPGNETKRIDLSDANYKNELQLLADK
ncbi:MAG: DUF3332 domain-containing protein [Bacteroidales bacterium]|nr:DUF3332 domain-containing protein [Bacteroidales bacterium]